MSPSRLAVVAAALAAVACSHPEPPASPASASASSAVTPRACDVGIWDDAAKACATPPAGATGAGGGWAGCSQASGPQNSRCFTGTRWLKERCECACEGGTTWDDAARRCH